MPDADPRIVGKIGFRIRSGIARPAAADIERLAAFGSNLVADGMNRFGAMSGRVRPLRPGWRLSGPATTVRTRGADNLMVMRAIGVAEPGDVLVIATGGHTGNAIWGELTTLAAIKRGLAGLVTDGAVRDSATLRELDFPVFCAGTTPAACDKDGPGEINFPIALGDVVVMPGDIVVADDDGVVIIPAADRADVEAGIAAKQASEEKRRRDIAAGIIVPDAVLSAVDGKLSQ